MDSGRRIYHNGTYVKESEAKISIFDSALMFGDMVFEMTRSFNKKTFKLEEHIERINASATAFFIESVWFISRWTVFIPSFLSVAKALSSLAVAITSKPC